MQTCNTARDPEAWLLNHPKLGNTRTFHLILHVYACVFVFFFPLCCGDSAECLRKRREGQTVLDSTRPQVSVMESLMPFFFFPALNEIRCVLFNMLDTHKCACVQACKHSRALVRKHHSTPWAPRWPASCLEVIKLGGTSREWEEEK